MDFSTTSPLTSEAGMMQYIDTKEGDIVLAIEEVHVSSTAGPDVCSVDMLKLCKRGLVKPLQFHFQSFLPNNRLTR